MAKKKKFNKGFNYSDMIIFHFTDHIVKEDLGRERIIFCFVIQ